MHARHVPLVRTAPQLGYQQLQTVVLPVSIQPHRLQSAHRAQSEPLLLPRHLRAAVDVLKVQTRFSDITFTGCPGLAIQISVSFISISPHAMHWFF